MPAASGTPKKSGGMGADENENMGENWAAAAAAPAPHLNFLSFFPHLWE
jgi:hypothetical protein